MQRPEIEGIAHVGIAVRDLDAALARYVDLLGFGRGESGEGLGVRLAFLTTGAGQTPLELVAPAEPGSPIDRFLERRGEGLHHIAFRVADIDAALAALAARGVRLIDREARVNPLGHRVAFLHPAEGNGVLLELVEE